MLLAGILAGPHGALSALLGGFINLTAGAAFGWIATRSRKQSPGEVLLALYRAEAAKVVLIVLQLWVVLANYKHVVFAAFFGTFTVTVILFSTAIFVRDK